MDSINNHYQPYVIINDVNAYKISDNYLIAINGDGVIQKLAEFSFNKKCLSKQELDLLKNRDINEFLNINYNKLIEKLGKPHVDVGSGFYIPAYISEDANLICFELEKEIVIEVIK